MKVLNRGVKMTVLGAIAASVAYLLQHVGDLQLGPVWSTVLTAVLTGIAAAIENAIKHRGQVPPVR